MEWIAEAIENDWKLSERRFFKVVEQNCDISDEKYSKVSVGSESMEIAKKTLYQSRNENDENCREK